MTSQAAFNHIPILTEALTVTSAQETTETVSGHPRMSALAIIFALPWCSRVWIIQETVLSRSLTLPWGKQEFAWEEISKLIDLLREEIARDIGFRIFVGQGRESQVRMWHL
jgi:hypothetical protein